MGKNTGTNDVGGQKGRGGGSPGHPEKGPSTVKIQPDNPKPVEVVQSDDDRLHLSRNSH